MVIKTMENWALVVFGGLMSLAAAILKAPALFRRNGNGNSKKTFTIDDCRQQQQVVKELFQSEMRILSEHINMIDERRLSAVNLLETHVDHIRERVDSLDKKVEHLQSQSQSIESRTLEILNHLKSR